MLENFFNNKDITLKASEAISYYKRNGAIYLYVIQGQNWGWHVARLLHAPSQGSKDVGK